MKNDRHKNTLLTFLGSWPAAPVMIWTMTMHSFVRQMIFDNLREAFELKFHGNHWPEAQFTFCCFRHHRKQQVSIHSSVSFSIRFVFWANATRRGIAQGLCVWSRIRKFGTRFSLSFCVASQYLKPSAYIALNTMYIHHWMEEGATCISMQHWFFDLASKARIWIRSLRVHFCCTKTFRVQSKRQDISRQFGRVV